MGYKELIEAFKPLLEEVRRLGGGKVIFINDVVKCAACGKKEVTLKGVRFWNIKKKEVIEIYQAKCPDCGNEIREKMVKKMGDGKNE